MSPEMVETGPRYVEPLVSVIMNCYNGEKFLREAIDSVFAQSYKNWEIIFWDNQSTDKSAEIFKSYKDARLKYFYAPTFTKLYEARNYPVAKASGAFIAFLDVDDLWKPDKLKLQIPLFGDKEVGFSCGKYILLDERGRKKSESEISRHADLPSGMVTNELLEDYFVHMSSLVVRRESLKKLGYFTDGRFSIIGDFDLAVRLSQICKLASIQTPITYYRWHGKNLGYVTNFLFCDEFDLWFTEAESRAEPYVKFPGYASLKGRNNWMKIIKALREGKRMEPFRMMRHETVLRQMKVVAALLLPNAIVKKIIG
jgi:glycosyltransferase involved in cell wall biosynthesis